MDSFLLLMSERKKIKISKDSRDIKEILEKLRLTKQSQLNTDETQECIAVLLKRLEEKEASPELFEAITELFRISAPKPFLDASEAALYFEMLFKLVYTRKINLSTFIEYRVPALLKDKLLIMRFVENYEKAAVNKEKYDEMLCIFINETADKKTLIDQLLVKNNLSFKLIGKIYKHIDISGLSEELYLKIYKEYISKLKVLEHPGEEIRAIKGKHRKSFVEAAVVNHTEYIAELYLRDKDSTIRELLAKNITEGTCFEHLLYDGDENVRIALLSKLSWETLPSVPVHHRLLDEKYKVREILYRIYREGLQALHNASIFKQGNKVLNAKEMKQIELFVHTLLKGCLTVYKNEFIQLLKESNFSIEYLMKIKDLPGAHVFLYSHEVKEWAELNKSNLGFTLKYFYKGIPTWAQISECISNDIYEILPFIKNINEHYDALLEKAIFSTDWSLAQKIAEMLSPFLKNKQIIWGPKEGYAEERFSLDAPTLLAQENYFKNENLYFINSHCKCPAAFIEDQFFTELNYPKLYFLAHKSDQDDRVVEEIQKCELNNMQLITLLAVLDKTEYLKLYIDRIMRISNSIEIKQYINSRKSIVGVIIYFLISGLISIKSSEVFMKCIEVSVCCTSQPHLKSIFKTYMGAVDDHTYAIFKSIAEKLKMCKCATNEPVLAMNKILIGDEKTGDLNESTVMKSFADNDGSILQTDLDRNKLHLTLRDRNLHEIAGLIAGMRPAHSLDVDIELEKYGFVIMSENEIEQVFSGQVTYK
ncbi:hypothetical protein ENBRE01_1365 [Enteropsectra breve]|nr:hypothetical protein ENBRE01_1365 [Enteropsectra breve]